MTTNLFSLYLMNFMFHTTLNAAGHILRVCYKSMKCDISFSQGSIACYLGEVDVFSCMCKNFLPAHSSVKVIKTEQHQSTEGTVQLAVYRLSGSRLPRSDQESHGLCNDTSEGGSAGLQNSR